MISVGTLYTLVSYEQLCESCCLSKNITNQKININSLYFRVKINFHLKNHQIPLGINKDTIKII